MGPLFPVCALAILSSFCLPITAEQAPNRCDGKSMITTKTECKACAFSSAVNCPEGYMKVTNGSGTRDCRYTFDLKAYSVQLPGCRHVCVQDFTVPLCCPGYWGPDCLECPGGAAKPCNNRGTCSQGIGGNGTCTCQERFGGTACETCTGDDVYGEDCRSACNCIHGACNSGINGDGSCDCFSGYRGQRCDELIPECLSLKCPKNSRCVQSSGGALECKCMPSYKGNGRICEPINPCEKIVCDPTAGVCTYLGPNLHQCSCREGYKGDGVVCLPIDPCQEKFGGCPTQSSLCKYDSPGKSHCTCKQGYNTFIPGAGCSLIDTCAVKNPCSKNANCSTFMPGVTVCKCLKGYVGNGFVCYGNLWERMREVNMERGLWQGKLTTALQFFDAAYAWPLKMQGPFTVLVPANSALLLSLMKIKGKGQYSKDKGQYTAKLHIIAGELDEQALKRGGVFYTLTGKSGEVTSGGMIPQTKIRLFGSKKSTSILKADILAYNGFLHIVDRAFDDVEPTLEGNTENTIMDILKANGRYSRFYSLLRGTDVGQRLDSDGPNTVIVPNNIALDQMPSSDIAYLASTQGASKLQELLKYHVVPSVELGVASVVPSHNIMTLANQNIHFNITSNGLIQVNGYNVIEADVAAKNGRIYTLDGVLIPPSILPILPQHCDLTNFTRTMGTCVSCSLLNRSTCLDGAVPLERFSRDCVYVDQATESIVQMGCRRYCNKTVKVPQCCSGFYGPECLECPGGFANLCSGNGKCSDGMEGDGLCYCNKGFKGTVCQYCWDLDKYGPNCNKKCPCLHGRCHNLINNDGSCMRGTCEIGYSGNNCDIQTSPCGPAVKYCHAHAACDFSKGAPRCVCNPGYEGDGTTCTEVNPCASSNGDACDVNAQCSHVSPGIHKCVCLNGWAGDGLECSAINNCLLSSYGGCHVNATCINIGPGQNDCRCKEGFRGNGIECQPINTCLSQIEKCHTLATCQLTSSGYWECVCREGYKGDGAVCYGNALNELSSVPEAAGFKGWVMAVPSISDMMSDTANITVLVPSIQAIDNMIQDDRTFWMSKDNIPALLKNHIFSGIYRSDDLQNTTADMVATNLQSSLLRLSKENGTLTIAGAHIVDEDIAATNGVLHIIDKVLMPLRSLVSPSPDLPDLLTRLGQMPDYSIFRGYIIQYNLAKEIEVSSAYTIFAPNNEAVEKYSHKKGAASLDEDLIKYHIVLGEQLLKNDLHIGMHRETMLGVSFQLGFLLHDGQLYVNDAPINYTDAATNIGVIHGLTKVIEMQKNRCDVNDTVTVQGKCANCLSRNNCPPGTKAILGPRKSCIYNEYRRGRRMVYVGCLPKCAGTNITKDCCSGFFGPQCSPCPGKLEVPCFGNGICLDRINGTGQCQCQEGFVGTACETCIKGKYGAACKQECSCIHGKCSEGTDGDGSCECDVGWRGVHCDSEIKDDKCNKACHTSANCLEKPDGVAYCKCASGFKGNGSVCTAVDACETSNGGCSTYADCKKTTPGNRQCVCRSGYAGDGVVCLEINPCTVNNGGCHVNAECTQIGANQSVCNCLKGYSGDGKLCEPINPCKIKRGGCSEFATCNNTGPDERVCTCKDSYFGDGFTCRGTIYQELPRNSNTSYFYYKLQSEGVREPQETGPFTVFVPSSEAMKNEPRVSAWAIGGVLSQILRYHIVACNQLLVSELASMGTVTSLQGEPIQTAYSRSQNSVLLNNQASIISSDIVTSNGIIHVINRVLVPPHLPEMKVKRLTKLDNLTVCAEKHGYGTFSKLLQDTDLLSLITDPLHKPVTIFWPSDKTIQSLPQEQQDFLFNKQNKDKLLETLKFHVVRDDKVSAYDLPSKKAMKTLQGSDLSVKCGSKGNGDLFLNDRQCKIVQRQLVFDGGIAYGIDCLLTPNSIGGHCDTLFTADSHGPCGHCFIAPPCPAGTKPRGGNKKCPYTTSYRRVVDGCQRYCALVMWIAKCCRGYFGKDCQACPGGPEFPCNSHGVCDDGYTGNGGCICNIGFNGTACELCDPGRYGPDCKSCDCSEHGQCEDGRTGSGQCTCESGWAGQKCETKLAVAPVCSPACSSNAICQENNTCLCKLFYEGDGITCTVVDLCKQNNGGCAQFSKCTQSDVKVSCSCENGYKGDGYICLPIDPCADGLNGGCHEHAICTMTGPNKHKCDCKDNYLGDGIDCEVKMLPIDRCSQENGQCHADADCADLHYQDTTVGVFHLQSTKGQYKLTYDEANKACINENAKIATYNQLLYAQKAGYHLCSAGWLDSARVGYPTAFSSPNCGSGSIGIVDYGVRPNISEMRDVFCYRVKDVKCTCKFGYVGDGYACSGNLLQVLMLFPMFSNFLSEVLQYSNRSAKGQEFVAYLTNLSIQATLFAPNNDAMGDNQTLSGRDIEYHLANISTFFYEDLNNGSQLQTRIGSQLLVTYDAALESMPKTYANISRLVEGRSILQWDIFASNGIIHVISRPLRAPPEPAAAMHNGIGAGVIFIILAVVALVVFAGYLYYKFSKGNIRFQKFRSNENISVSALDKPSLSNPMYDSSTTSAASEPVPTFDAFSDSDEQQLVTDEPYD